MSSRWDFTLKVGDTGPDLEVQLLDEDGDPVNIAGYTSVKFRMMDEKTRTRKVYADAIVVNEYAGIVKYVWSSSDTDTAGPFLGDFLVKLGTGQDVSFPNNDYIKIYIYERIDPP